METKTPLPPLVSDEQAFSDEAPFSRHFTSDEAMLNYLRDIYEADRAKTREVVQALCDTLAYVTSRNFGDEHARIMFYANGGKSPEKAIALAKSINIEPTK